MKIEIRHTTKTETQTNFEFKISKQQVIMSLQLQETRREPNKKKKR